MTRMNFSGILFIVLAMTLSSCSAARKFQKPQGPEISASQFTEDAPGRFEAAEPASAWWKNFDDPVLSSLMESALEHNLDLRIALENLAQARAFVSEIWADRLPTVIGGASYQRQRFSEEGLQPIAGQRSFNVYDAGFDAIWEADLFGRVGERIDLARALEGQSLAEFRAVSVTIMAETARSYMELRGAQLRLGIARKNAEIQQQTFGIIEERTAAGRGTDRDVARAETQLQLTLAIIPQREAEVASAVHRIGVLTGRAPSALKEELGAARPLPSIPPTVRVGAPEDLLRRRPDIQFAEQGIEAARAQYNLSARELFPEISLQGSLGFAATTFSNWFSAGALATSFGPTLRWRILDLKRVLAQIDQADHAARESLLFYEKTLLEALEEVETALVNFSKEEERRQNLIRAAAASAKASDFARSRFESGLDSFLDLLDSERTRLEAEDALAVSETLTAVKLVAIYKALGGGWEIVPAEPQPSERT